MLMRGPAEERLRLDLLGSLAVPTASGRSVPLSQIATLDYVLRGRRRSGIATACRPMTVRADISRQADRADGDRADPADAGGVRGQLP